MPEGFTVHPRLAPQLQRRAQMVEHDQIDWAMGEALAIGSLLTEGRSVRLAGQDSRRGTFGQRHAVIVDRQTGWQYKPLKRLYEDGAKLYVYDSPLSEFAAVGFEYGYSVARPDALVLWEAQFGDFVNGAQTIIDEFISSGEQKWGQRSSLVLLLPHGQEGQGPDHSSARVERFLQMCAEDNMTVAMPSTPASFFHLLRWQVHSELHRPLIVFTPKSMLRLKAAASATADFTSGYFRAVQPDTTVDAAGVRKVLLCSGKVYCDLVAEREAKGITDTAIIRLGAALPAPVPDAAAQALDALSRARGRALGPGGAGQPGRVDVHGARRTGRHRPAADPGSHAMPRRHRPWAPTTGTTPSSVSSSRTPSPDRQPQAPRRPRGTHVYATDRGIEELDARRGEEQVTLAWLAGRLAEFVDLNPEFETPVERLATWLARLDDDAGRTLSTAPSRSARSRTILPKVSPLARRSKAERASASAYVESMRGRVPVETQQREQCLAAPRGCPSSSR